MILGDAEAYEKYLLGLSPGELVLEFENKVIDLCSGGEGRDYEKILFCRRQIVRRLKDGDPNRPRT